MPVGSLFNGRLFFPRASVTTPVTAAMSWSLPSDRAAGTTAAVVAVRQRVTVAEETDVRLTFDAAGSAATASDIAAWTIGAEITSNTASAPVATEPVITINSATQFEAAFSAASASGVTPGTYTMSVYRTGTSVRTELALVVVTVAATAYQP